MNISTRLLLVFTLFASASIGTVQANEGQTIVDIASQNEDFSFLVAAVADQELVATLSGEGPFTVFAPTNAAFAALPTIATDILATKPELLSNILLYHVVSGKLLAADVLAAETLETVGGGTLTVNASNVKVNESGITATDIEASNGVIHVIDSVLIPQSVTDEIVLQLTIQLRDLYITLRDLYLARI